MKPALVHPSEDTWRFEQTDALGQWRVDNNLGIHGHTLVWHAQTNNWFFRDGDLRLVELTAEVSGIQPGGVDQVIIANASRVAGSNIGRTL